MHEVDRRRAIAALGGVNGVVCAWILDASFTTGKVSSTEIGLDAATGEKLWHIDTGLPMVTATAGIVFLMALAPSANGTVDVPMQGRRMKSGELAWKRTFSNGQPTLAAGNDGLYIGAGARTLLAVAAQSGDTLWIRQLGAQLLAAALDGNMLYALDASGYVYAIRA
jgi:outer membrane protein assembly factor BamB